MRRFLYVAGVLDVTWVLISLGGIIIDPDALTFWSQNLMGALLLAVFIAPALVFSRSDSSAKSSSRPVKVRQPRSAARVVTYALSGLLTLWLFGSLFGLFLQSDQIAFWGQSLMWSFIATILVAPLLVFVVNPFQNPVLVEEGSEDESVEPFIPEEAYAPSFLETPTEQDAPAPTSLADERTREDVVDEDVVGEVGADEAGPDARQGWPWNVEESAEKAADEAAEEAVAEARAAAEDVSNAELSVDSDSGRASSPGSPNEGRDERPAPEPRRESSSPGTPPKAPSNVRIKPPTADEDWPVWPDD